MHMHWFALWYFLLPNQPTLIPTSFSQGRWQKSCSTFAGSYCLLSQQLNQPGKWLTRHFDFTLSVSKYLSIFDILMDNTQCLVCVCVFNSRMQLQVHKVFSDYTIVQTKMSVSLDFYFFPQIQILSCGETPRLASLVPRWTQPIHALLFSLTVRMLIPMMLISCLGFPIRFSVGSPLPPFSSPVHAVAQTNSPSEMYI